MRLVGCSFNPWYGSGFRSDRKPVNPCHGTDFLAVYSTSNLLIHQFFILPKLLSITHDSLSVISRIKRNAIDCHLACNAVELSLNLNQFIFVDLLCVVYAHAVLPLKLVPAREDLMILVTVSSSSSQSSVATFVISAWK